MWGHGLGLARPRAASGCCPELAVPATSRRPLANERRLPCDQYRSFVMPARLDPIVHRLVDGPQERHTLQHLTLTLLVSRASASTFSGGLRYGPATSRNSSITDAPMESLKV